MNRWYVITGGPSTGKTTLLDELSKMGHCTVPEAARLLINRAIEEGRSVESLRKNEKAFQHAVLELKAENEAIYSKNMVTFFDRGMHDTLAYLRLHGYEIDEKVQEIAKRSTYAKVFLLEPPQEFESDYARTETPEEAIKLNRLISDAFTEYGMKPITVPPLPPRERAEFVLQHVL